MLKSLTLRHLNNQRGSCGLWSFLSFLHCFYGDFRDHRVRRADVRQSCRGRSRPGGGAIRHVYDYELALTRPPRAATITNTNGAIRRNVKDVVDRYMRHNLGDGNYFLINFDEEPVNQPTVAVERVVNDDGTLVEYVLSVEVRTAFISFF